ncbi:MAG TPA: hypothetical protein VNW97_03430 [Candidatus Saccharimonadales bacterium]|jgi:hypothetical protein|nr:hypothetical protein [Candidatus Saccharimonadales bacterium]
MITGWIVALVMVVCARTAWRRFYRFPDRTEHDVVSYLMLIDLGELSDLVDTLMEERLRYELPPREFRQAQLKRLRLLQEYTRWMRRNADILQEWGEYGFHRRLHAAEDGIRSGSLQLIEASRHFRHGARAIQLRLHILFIRMNLFPSRPVPLLAPARHIDETFDLLFAYQSLRIAAEYLSRAYGEDCYENLAQVL